MYWKWKDNSDLRNCFSGQVRPGSILPRSRSRSASHILTEKKNSRSISPHYVYFTTMWMGDGGCGTRRFEISITTHIQKITTISKKNLLWCDKPLHALAPRHRRLTRYLRRTRPTSAPHPTLGALSDKRAKAPPCLINSFERDPAVPSTTVRYRI
jgi:hypothetical protein